MKTSLLKFFAILSLSSLIIAPTAFIAVGCTTPQQTAYKTSASVVHGVDLAMQGWADYVIAERVRIASLSNEEQGPAKDALLRKEGSVLNAYGSYQTAVRLAAALNTPNSAAAISQASADLVKLINETKK